MTRISRPSWKLPGLFGDYIVVREMEATAEDRAPNLFVPSLLDAWLSSPFVAETVYNLYETLGGFRPRGLTVSERKRYDERLKRSIIEAFEHGRLVALEARRVRPSLGLDQPEPRSEPELPPEEAIETTFIAILLLDAEGRPAPGMKYRLILPDGSAREGALNSEGFARIEGIHPGMCQIAFPEIDGREWN